MEKKESKTISELGEFGLIEHITKQFTYSENQVIKGIGDDAAVLQNELETTVITTDMLVEGIHFDLVYAPLKHLGYKSVIVNLSDLYAMNAVPVAITVSIAISNKFSLQAIEEIYSGIELACSIYGVNLIGGDTSSSVTGLMISVTAIGKAEKDDLVYRNGAKDNDLICVSGNLGAAYLGLQLLEREKELFLSDNKIQPNLENCEYILERQLKPEARKDIINLLSENKIKPNSMIDISDGLSSDIMHICKKSEKGCKIFGNKIPVHSQSHKMAEKFNINPLVAALNGGEDYELLFTVPLSFKEKIEGIADISVIGYICGQEQGTVLVTEGGYETELKAQGWNPLKE